MQLFMQLLIAALALGGLYALITLGLNLVYGTTRFLNIAHGAVIMLGAYVTYWCFASYGISPFVSAIITAIGGALVGVVLYWGLLRHLVQRAVNAEALEISSVLLFFGLLIMMESSAISLWSSDTRGYSYLDQSVTILGASILMGRLIAALAAIFLTLVIYLAINYTDTGKAVQAVVQDRHGAALMGIRSDVLYTICVAVGFAMAAMGGSLISMFRQISPTMGLHYTVVAFSILILGGMGNFGGTLLAAFLMAMVETFGGHLTSPAFKSILAYGLFIGALIIRPTGLFGKAIVER